MSMMSSNPNIKRIDISNLQTLDLSNLHESDLDSSDGFKNGGILNKNHRKI